MLRLFIAGILTLLGSLLFGSTMINASASCTGAVNTSVSSTGNPISNGTSGGVLTGPCGEGAGLISTAGAGALIGGEIQTEAHAVAGVGTSSTASGTGQFSDVLTISGGSGTGVIGYDIGYSVFASQGGTSTFSFFQGSVPMLSSTTDSNNQVCVDGGTCYPSSPSAIATAGHLPVVKANFTFDVPFEIHDIGTSTATTGANGTAEAFQLMTLPNVFIYDNKGNLLNGHVTISDQSGFVYPGPTAIPEPSTITLTLMGTLALIRLRLRKQS